MPSDVPPGTSRGETEELRRIAFGRDSTSEERAAATRELAKLATAENATPLPDSAAAPAESSSENSDAEAGAAEPAASDSTIAAQPVPVRRRRIAMVWLLPAVIASLVVGTVAGRATVSSQPTPAPTSTTSWLPIADPSANPGNGIAGNLVAANAWLARTPTKADTFPELGVIDGQSLSAVRHIKDVQDNDILITVWGAKDHSDGICLLAGLPGGFFATTCVPPKVFTERGINLGFNGFEVSWDGVATSLTLPMSAVPN
jgi:hypothetical protein